MNFFFSILTCTFNRKEDIKKLIKSLKKQKFKNFEWVVGDDGSTDGTDEFITSLSKKNKLGFKVTFIKSTHRIGISKMQNILHSYMRGKTFFVCDSDDYLKSNALTHIYNIFRSIPKKKLKNLLGVISGNVDEQGKNQLFYNEKVPKKSYFTKLIDLHDDTYGDGTLIAFTKYFKRKKFLEVDFYIPVSTIYNFFLNKSLFVSHQIFKIMKRNTKNSISSSKKMGYSRGNAYAIAICEKGALFAKRSFFYKIKIIINYFRYCYHGDVPFLKTINLWKLIKSKKILLLLSLISLAICFRDIILDKVYKTHIEFNHNKKIAKISKKQL